MSAAWSGRRVLVTGGTSMLGRPLTERLVAEGARVLVPSRSPVSPVAGADFVQGDIRDAAFCERLVRDADAVFHLASHRRNVAYHREHREEIYGDNLLMAESLLGALRSKPAIPVTVYSTALVGTLASDADPASVPDGYLAAKLATERLWSALPNPLLIVRPASAYGPWDNFGADANVIPSLLLRAAAEPELTAWGSGKQRRTFAFAPDVADAVLTLHAEGVTGAQFVNPPESVSIRELAETIRDLVRPELPIRFDASKPEGPDLPVFPVPAALRSFPWTPLPEGLRRTLDWYKASL